MIKYLIVLLCFFGALRANAVSVVVENAAQFTNALKARAAGDTVWLKDGDYAGNFSVTGEGAAQNPIVVSAVNAGKVVLTGSSSGTTMNIYGSYLEVHGVVFRPKAATTVLEFRKSGGGAYANHCRVTNCVLDGANVPLTGNNLGPKWCFLWGQHNRIDHCLFVNRNTDAGVTLCVELGSGSGEAIHLNNYHRIDHNYFGYRPLASADNEAETIRIGVSGTSKSPSRTIVEDNIFYRCNGEVECVSIKSGNNIVRRNLFHNVEATLCLRHGDTTVVEGNVFMGEAGIPAGGLRIVNPGHKIYNNYFQDLEGEKYNSALSFMRGAVNTSNSGYEAVDGVELVYNTFINCSSILFGLTGSNPQPTWAKNTVVANNIFHNTNSATVYQTFSTGAGDSPNMSGITFRNNVVATKNGNLNEAGFQEAALDLKTVDGITLIDECTPPLVGAGSYLYVEKDITGSTREGGKDIGAFQVDNLVKPFGTPLLTDLHKGVGTTYSYSINGVNKN